MFCNLLNDQEKAVICFFLTNYMVHPTIFFILVEKNTSSGLPLEWNVLYSFFQCY